MLSTNTALTNTLKDMLPLKFSGGVLTTCDAVEQSLRELVPEEDVQITFSIFRVLQDIKHQNKHFWTI